MAAPETQTVPLTPQETVPDQSAPRLVTSSSLPIIEEPPSPAPSLSREEPMEPADEFPPPPTIEFLSETLVPDPVADAGPSRKRARTPTSDGEDSSIMEIPDPRTPPPIVDLSSEKEPEEDPEDDSEEDPEEDPEEELPQQPIPTSDPSPQASETVPHEPPRVTTTTAGPSRPRRPTLDETQEVSAHILDRTIASLQRELRRFVYAAQISEERRQMAEITLRDILDTHQWTPTQETLYRRLRSLYEDITTPSTPPSD